MVVAVFFVLCLPLILMFNKGKAVKLSGDSVAAE
jgi:hypothetical protein